MARILIVEDDRGLSRGIALSLAGPDHTFAACGSLGEARAALAAGAFDLILLDVGLPDGSGLDLCREVRKASPTPILFLTANDTELDEVAGLEAGGDDYLAKPFSLAVLRARVAALLRRSAPQPGQVYRAGGLELDFGGMVFKKNGELLSLSKTEQRLLRLLVENRGRTLSRETLLDRVWDGGEFVDENTLSVAVRRLRAKVEEDPRAPRFIGTVYGLGYTWKEGGT